MDEKTPLQDLYNGLVAKNPQLKDRGFDAFKQDMQDENNLKGVFSGLTSKNKALNDYGFDAFKNDMFPEVKTENKPIVQQEIPEPIQPPVQTADPDSIKKFRQNPRSAMGMDVDTAKQIATQVADENTKESNFISKLGKTAWNELNIGSGQLGSWIADVPGLIYDVAGAPFRVVGLNVPKAEDFKGGALEQVSDYYKKNSKAFEQKVEEINPGRENGIVNEFKKGNVEQGVLNLVGSISESLPASLAMIMSGGQTLPTVLGSAAVFGAGKVQELDENAPEMDYDKRRMIGVLNGTLEGVFETWLGSGAVGRSLSDIIKREGKEEAKKQIKRSWSDVFSNMLTRNPWLAPLGEGFEEVGTQITQNMVDKYSGYRPDINLTESVGDAFAAGVGMGGIHGSVLSLAQKVIGEAPVKPEQQTPGVNPQQQTDAIFEQFLNETNQKADLFQHEKGVYVKAKDLNGDTFYITKGDLNSESGLLFAINEEGKEVQLPTSVIKDFDIIQDKETFVNNHIQEFQEQKAQVDNNSMVIEGKRFLILGEQIPGSMALQAVDEMGNPLDVNIAQVPVEQFNAMVQSKESLQSQSPVKDEKINNEQSPVNEKSVQPVTREQQHVQETPIPQKLGKNSFDIIEREGYDEVVPTDNMPLDKALPILEKEFENRPNFEVVPTKVLIEVPGETKYDEPVKKVVIKSIRIQQKNKNQSNSKYDQTIESQKEKKLKIENQSTDVFQVGNNKYDFIKSQDGSYTALFKEGTDPVEAEKEIRGTLPKEQNRFEPITEEIEVPGEYPWNSPEKKIVTRGIKVLPEKSALSEKQENVDTPTEDTKTKYYGLSVEPESVSISSDEINTQSGVKPVTETYNLLKENWFANKDQENVIANVDTRNFQQRIKDSFDSSLNKEARSWKDIDRAIHVYLDGIDPETISQYWDSLSNEQKRIIRIVQSLTPSQKAIADEIRAIYDSVGERALDQEIISNVLDNYVSRVWDLSNEKPSHETFTKFNTNTRHSKLRTLGSILEGWSKGYNLKIEGATNNLETLRIEINNVIENKRLLNIGLKTKTINGQPLFTTHRLDGYKEIEHPNFRKWIKWGNVETNKKYRGDNFFISEDGSVFEKKRVYAPAEIAKNLNNILGKSKLNEIPGIEWLTRLNARLKATILSWSFFHHMAFTRSYIWGSAIKGFKDINPVKAYKTGLELLNAKDPEVIHLVRNGLTLGRNNEFDELLTEQKTKIGRWLDEHKVAPGVREKIFNFHESHVHFLFNKYGAGLKVKSALLEYYHLLKKYPEFDPDELARKVARQTNADFGGLHLERMGRNKSMQHFLRLTLLAPDWTESNIITMVRVFDSATLNNAYRKVTKKEALTKEEKESLQIERRMYQRFWQRTFFRVAFSSVALNLLMALRVLFDDDDETEYWNEVTETYKKAFEDPERGNWLAVDITPLHKWISAKDEYEKDGDVNKYFSLLGHFYDPVKFIIAPTQSFKNKSSVIGKTVMEFMQGENWQGKRFTSLDELLGIDNKGQYKTSNKKYGYRVGDPKGGKNKGQLTRWRRPGDYGPVKYEEIPSFLLGTFRGFLPVPLQNGLAFALGEIDAFDAVSHGVGIHLNSKRNYPKLQREYDKAVDEAEIHIRTIKDKLKHGELEEAKELSKDTQRTTNASTIIKLDKNIKSLRERCLNLKETGKDDEAEKIQEMIDERMQQVIDLINSK